MIRVIAGSAKGLLLKVPKGRITRPTSDRVRESIFNILGDRVSGAKVLDVFAGTGALGIEALSRGAERALFVEQDRRVAKLLEENLDRTGFGERARLVIGSVPRLRTIGPGGYDLVFMDPPYGRGLAIEAFEWLERVRALDAEALVVLEHGVKEEMPSRLTKFDRVRQERYGETCVSFWS